MKIWTHFISILSIKTVSSRLNSKLRWVTDQNFVFSIFEVKIDFCAFQTLLEKFPQKSSLEKCCPNFNFNFNFSCFRMVLELWSSGVRVIQDLIWCPSFSDSSPRQFCPNPIFVEIFPKVSEPRREQLQFKIQEKNSVCFPSLIRSS